jgi:hypothetical protein
MFPGVQLRLGFPSQGGVKGIGSGGPLAVSQRLRAAIVIFLPLRQYLHWQNDQDDGGKPGTES